MKYTISTSSHGIKSEEMDIFDKDIVEFLKQQFKFKTKDFDLFILVLNYYNKEMMDTFGDDRFQVSKKERTLFLGVCIFLEVIQDSSLSYNQKLQYHFDRINEVKQTNLSRLFKQAMMQ